MNAEPSTTQSQPAVSCTKCDHESPIHFLRCEQCGSHLYVACKHCGTLNLRQGERCSECRTQLHQRGVPKWKQAKARKWIQPVSYALLVLGSLLTFYGIVLISEMDRRESEPAPLYITVDEEALQEIDFR